MKLEEQLYNVIDVILGTPTEELCSIDDGIVFNGSTISPQLKDELQSIMYKKNKQLEAKKIKDKSDELKVFVDNTLGSFYFQNYSNLIAKLDKDTALMFRFLYLCTYTDYDNYLKYGDTYMTEHDFKDVFNLSINMITSLKKQLYKYNLIIKDEIGIRVNSHIHHKGTVDSKRFKDNTTRVFNNGIRNLYEKSIPKEHKKLGVLVLLLPYLNVHTNILCRFTHIEDKTECRPLTTNEIGDIIGYQKTNVYNFKNKLVNTTVGGEPVLINITHNKVDMYIVNPLLFYKGSNLDNLKETISYFHTKNLGR